MTKYLVILLFALPTFPVFAEITNEDIAELLEEVKYSNELTAAGHNQIKQAMLEIYQKTDVQAAIKSIPDLTTRVELEARERRTNTDKIGFFGSVLQAHELRLRGIEETNVRQVSILGDIKTGLVLALNYVREQKDKDNIDRDSKSRLRDIFLGFLTTSLLVLLNWLRTRRRDKALEKIAGSHTDK